MMARLAIVVLLISWLVMHPEAGNHHAGQVIIADSK
jgi:hypothetical protein